MKKIDNDYESINSFDKESIKKINEQLARNIANQSIGNVRKRLLKHLNDELKTHTNFKPRQNEKSSSDIKKLIQTIEKSSLEDWIVLDYLDGEEIPPHIPTKEPPYTPDSEEFCYVTPFVDAEEIYKSLYDDLLQAAQIAKHIFIAMWQLETDFVINKPPEELLAKFITDALANNPDLQVYVLLWRPIWVTKAGKSVIPIPNLSTPLKKFLNSVIGPAVTTKLLQQYPLLSQLNLNGILGEAPGIFDPSKFSNPQDANRLHVAWHDNIDPKNPKTIDGIRGSHHQKFVLMDVPGDGASLHCLGLNLADLYWDSALHTPTPYPKPHHPKKDNSWHDTGVRVVGKPIHDFELEFRRRWQKATGTALNPPQGQFFFNYTPTHGHVPTYSKFNQERNGLKDVNSWYLSSIPSAEHYVYLENQYFSVKDIAVTLVDQYLKLNKNKKKFDVAVVLPHTHVMSPFLEVPKAEENVMYMRLMTADEIWYHDIFGILKKIKRPKGGWRGMKIAQIFGIKFIELVDINGNVSQLFKIEKTIGGIRVYTMIRPGVLKTKKVLKKKFILKEPVWVYVHSKTCIIDDMYTIGSCNISKQSFQIDSESNVVVDDKNETSKLLSKLWPPILGYKTPKNVDPSNANAWLKKMNDSSHQNMQDIKNRIVPKGMFVDFPYAIPNPILLALVTSLGI